jgi:hypothetical protein
VNCQEAPGRLVVRDSEGAADCSLWAGVDRPGEWRLAWWRRCVRRGAPDRHNGLGAAGIRRSRD